MQTLMQFLTFLNRKIDVFCFNLYSYLLLLHFELLLNFVLLVVKTLEVNSFGRDIPGLPPTYMNPWYIRTRIYTYIYMYAYI